MPSRRRITEQARLDSLMTALWLSVALAAAILPFRSRALRTNSSVSAPLGGHISAVMAKPPASRTVFRLLPPSVMSKPYLQKFSPEFGNVLFAKRLVPVRLGKPVFRNCAARIFILGRVSDPA